MVGLNTNESSVAKIHSKLLFSHSKTTSVLRKSAIFGDFDPFPLTVSFFIHQGYLTHFISGAKCISLVERASKIIA